MATTWQTCYNGNGLNGGHYLIHKAEQAGLKVCNGKGDHTTVFAPVGRGYMTIPQRELGKGLACAIRKWLVAAGVLFTLAFAIWWYWPVIIGG